MRNILLLVLNTLKVTFRRKGNIILYLILPIAGVLLSILIYSNSQAGSVQLGLVNKDASTLASDFENLVSNVNGYTVYTMDESEVKNQLLDRKLDAVVVIPEGYSESIHSHQSPNITIMSIKGQEATVWIENYINLYTRNLMDLSVASEGNMDTFESMYKSYRTNRLKLSEATLEDKQTDRLMTMTSMGFLIMFIMLGAGFTSQFILNEKRNRTYYRICSAPVSSREYIAGNILTSILIVTFQSILILASMKYLFGIETFVPDFILFLILISFGITATGISLLVTAFSGSSFTASTLNTLILTPTCMLGGCFWDVDLMSGFMKNISYFVPQRWTLEAIKKMQSGSPFSDILINLVIIYAFAIAMFLIAAYRFSRADNVQKFV